MVRGKTNTAPSSKEKIKEAARSVFMRKGFAATRTRDIAQEAGINLALLNYYFRSKQSLFEEIMLEKIQKLLSTVIPILSNAETSLEEKIDSIAAHYIDVLTANPDLPMFVLSELDKGNFKIVEHINLGSAMLNSSFVYQLGERNKDLNPVHFLISILGMIIFPFLARPMMFMSGMADEQSFIPLMNQRKLLIPIWAEAILNSGKVKS